MESNNKAFSYAGVHILNAPYQIDKEYDYSIPKNLESVLAVGSVVIVPFGGGNRHVAGIVSSMKTSTDYPKSKPIIGVAPGNLCIGEELYGICRFLKERCFCSIGEASKAVMPSGFSVRTSVYYEPCGKEPSEEINAMASEIVKYISDKGEATESELNSVFEKCLPSLKLLCSKGYLRRMSRADCKINTKSSKYVRLLLSTEELSEIYLSPKSGYTPKQRIALSELEKNPFSPLEELRELSGISEAVIKELCKKNAAEILPIPKDRNPYAFIAKTENCDFELSNCQKKAFDTLLGLYNTNEPKAALLHGVTGSGKTNVVQKLVDKCINDGKSAIVLVPEIALTTQAVGIFMGRYGNKVAVLHSGLSAGERLDAWRRIDNGDACVVLGTRSAIFAPVKNLGLIVIDEEQEASFKSEMTPRYHARDIARYRCSQNNALMLLCSATTALKATTRQKRALTHLWK
ncbi:MAG: DEAD/DEAH box helicase [Clostridia bacterium]|nr:DEAD/DEAH box helicase [Clostridia bacterium]